MEEEKELRYVFQLNEHPPARLIIVDEASMISSRAQVNELLQFGSQNLLDDLLTYARFRGGTQIIFVGDSVQLPPVGDNRSAALDEDYFRGLGLGVDSFTLTDVVRQEGNSPILANAQMLRELFSSENRNRLVFHKSPDEVMDIDARQIAERYCQEKDAAIVCFSNSIAADYNAAVRRILFPGCSQLVAGDRLIVVSNNYYSGNVLYNGDIITVLEVSEELKEIEEEVKHRHGAGNERLEIQLTFRKIKFQTDTGEEREQYIIETLLNSHAPSLSVEQMRAIYRNCKRRRLTTVAAMLNDPFYSALHVKYGYAFTCHKAQGGEWDTVFVDFTKRNGLSDDQLRWKYTAITRASRVLWLANHPDITPICKLKINQIQLSSKMSLDAFAWSSDLQHAYPNGDDAPLHLRVKYDSVAQNLSGTAYSIRRVESKDYREIYYITSAAGEVRVDAIYNGAGTFTKFESPETDLLDYFREEGNIRFAIAYTPSSDALGELYARMISLCDECDITLTNVVEGRYNVVYYMRTSGHYASLTFHYNAKGMISHGKPASDLGQEDEKLQMLISKLV